MTVYLYKRLDKVLHSRYLARAIIIKVIRLKLHQEVGMDKWLEKFMALSIGEKIIVIAGLLFFIDGFLPWFDYDVPGGPSRSGWSGDLSFLSIIAILAAVVMVAQIVVARFTAVQLPALPQGLTWPRVHLGLAGYVAFAVVIRLIVGESAGPIDADMAFGLWIAVILAAALAAGAFLLYREEMAGQA